MSASKAITNASTTKAMRQKRNEWGCLERAVSSVCMARFVASGGTGTGQIPAALVVQRTSRQTRMSAKTKGELITSNKMIRKFYAVLSYFLAILISHVIGGYYGDADFMVKAVVAIIAVSELQSVRENIKGVTNLDILKPLINMLERKSE
jgi:hypothetical protein